MTSTTSSRPAKIPNPLKHHDRCAAGIAALLPPALNSLLKKVEAGDLRAVELVLRLSGIATAEGRTGLCADPHHEWFSRFSYGQVFLLMLLEGLVIKHKRYELKRPDWTPLLEYIFCRDQERGDD